MQYSEILKRAWYYTHRHRALWLLGAILALTTVNGLYFLYDPDPNPGWHGFQVVDGTVYLPGEGVIIDFRDPGWPSIGVEDWDPDELRELLTWQWWRDGIPAGVQAIIISSVVVLAGIALAGIIGRYVAEAGLIRVVNQAEEGSSAMGMRRALRLGLSRSAWRLFGIDLLAFLFKLLVYTALLAGAVSPLLFWKTRSNAAAVAGTAAALAMLLLWLIVVLAIGAGLSLLIQVVRRACAVDELGVMASIRRGLRTVRTNMKEVTVMWLTWLGVRLAWTLASVPVLIVISPLFLPLLLVGALAGGLPAIAVAGALSPVLDGPFNWIVGAIVGGPIFVLVMMAPMLFLGGLVEVFKSSMWTLTYRELRSSPSPEPVRKPSGEMSGLEVAPAA